MAVVPRVLLDQVEQDPSHVGARPSGQVRRATECQSQSESAFQSTVVLSQST
jgi:hypothetical protein